MQATLYTTNSSKIAILNTIKPNKDKNSTHKKKITKITVQKQR